MSCDVTCLSNPDSTVTSGALPLLRASSRVSAYYRKLQLQIRALVCKLSDRSSTTLETTVSALWAPRKKSASVPASNFFLGTIRFEPKKHNAREGRKQLEV